MLTKNDLEAIKGIVQENNKIFGTILRVELAVTNKRVDTVESNIRELQRNTKELRVDMKDLKRGQERMEQKIDKLDYEA